MVGIIPNFSGSDRILYKDNTGPYYIDEFNHLVYVFDYGMGTYHVNCEGEYRQVTQHLWIFIQLMLDEQPLLFPILKVTG